PATDSPAGALTLAPSPGYPYVSRTPPSSSRFFFFNDTATPEIYTLSLHDALPIFPILGSIRNPARLQDVLRTWRVSTIYHAAARSEEHTSELQSRENLVCRLLLEKKK